MKISNLITTPMCLGGLTRFALAFDKYLTLFGNQVCTIDYDCHIPYSSEPGTNNTESLSDYHYLDPNKSGISDLIDKVNASDVLFCQDCTPVKTTVENMELFMDFIDAVKVPIVYICHAVTFIDNNRRETVSYLIKKASKVISFSEKGYFANWARLIKPGVRFGTFCPALDMMEIKNKHWRPIEEQTPNQVRWIGRLGFPKREETFIDFATKELVEDKYSVIMEGWSKGLNYRKHIHSDGTPVNKLLQTQFITNEKFDNEDPDMVDAYRGKIITMPGYNNSEMLSRMSRTPIGAQTTFVTKQNIGHYVEYVVQEIVAAGAIPLMLKRWGDNSFLPGGAPLSSLDTGTLFIGDRKIKSKMKDICNDHAFRDAEREKAFDFYYKHFDGSVQFKLLEEHIKSVL